MSQNNVDYSQNPTGPELMDNYLSKTQENSRTCNSGISRPSYAVKGTVWLDTSVTPNLLKQYDGNSDIILGSLDVTNHVFLSSDSLLANGGTANYVLTGNGANTRPSYQKNPIGVYEYLTTKTYNLNEFVIGIVNGDAGLYKSLQSNNLNHVLTDTSWWESVPLGGDSNSRNIGEVVQSTIPLTDAGLHLLDGSLISSGAYGEFVTYISGLVSSYPNLFVSESDWQTAVATYGVCGKFVYDSVNNTVRLPKYGNKVYTSSMANSAPTYTDSRANSSEITAINLYTSSGDIPSSKYSKSGMSTTLGISNGQIWQYDVGSNAFQNHAQAYTKAITDLSNITAPLDGYYYIVVATSIKTDIEVDIDEVMTDLNGKADVDMSNVTTSGKSLISGLSMPSNRYTDLTLGASGSTYTAPANGYFYLEKIADATGKYLALYNNTTGLSFEAYPNATANYARTWIMAKKGDSVTAGYNVTGATVMFRFIYAEGEQNV